MGVPRQGRWSLWTPVVAQAAVIFWLSSLSNPPLATGGWTNVGGHFTMFAALGAAWVRALAGGTWDGLTWRRCVAAIVATAVYGVIDEAHQSLVPNRTPQVIDVVTDTAGAAAAAAAIWAWSIIRRPGFAASAVAPEARVKLDE